MQMNLRMLSTIVFCTGVWYAVIQYARWREDPVWWDRAEIVGGVAGLVTIVGWLPLGRALDRWGLVDKPVLWSLKWTLIGVVTAMFFTLITKILLEEEGIWDPVEGVEERREMTFGDDGSASAGSGGGDP